MTKSIGFKIIMSRWRKENKTEEVFNKRIVCSTCEYNSLNMYKVPLKKRILKNLSDLYSFICGKLDDDNLGNCTVCESCSIFFKSQDEQICPHPLGDKWKSIYIPNSAQKIKNKSK